jgi:hypothetical protein
LGGAPGGYWAGQAPVLLLSSKNVGCVLRTMIYNVMVKIRTDNISIKV